MDSSTDQNHISTTSDDSQTLSEQKENDELKQIEFSPQQNYAKYNKVLGRGAFKTVYLGQDLNDASQIAWNEIAISKYGQRDRRRMMNEVMLLRKLSHPQLISFYGAWVNKEAEKVVFITELMSSGTLKDFCGKYPIPLKTIKRYCISILECIDYLHTPQYKEVSDSAHPFNPEDPSTATHAIDESGREKVKDRVIHRDLKCDNIFISNDGKGIKIGDLGLATTDSRSILGTPEFMAPEMYEPGYGTTVDIYAFGLCLLEMITGKSPYIECSSVVQIYKTVLDGILPENLRVVEHGWPEAYEFILRCLCPIVEANSDSTDSSPKDDNSHDEDDSHGSDDASISANAETDITSAKDHQKSSEGLNENRSISPRNRVASSTSLASEASPRGADNSTQHSTVNHSHSHTMSTVASVTGPTVRRPTALELLSDPFLEIQPEDHIRTTLDVREIARSKGFHVINNSEDVNRRRDLKPLRAIPRLAAPAPVLAEPSSYEEKLDSDTIISNTDNQSITSHSVQEETTSTAPTSPGHSDIGKDTPLRDAGPPLETLSIPMSYAAAAAIGTPAESHFADSYAVPMSSSSFPSAHASPALSTRSDSSTSQMPSPLNSRSGTPDVSEHKPSMTTILHSPTVEELAVHDVMNASTGDAGAATVMHDDIVGVNFQENTTSSSHASSSSALLSSPFLHTDYPPSTSSDLSMTLDNVPSPVEQLPPRAIEDFPLSNPSMNQGSRNICPSITNVSEDTLVRAVETAVAPLVTEIAALRASFARQEHAISFLVSLLVPSQQLPFLQSPLMNSTGTNESGMGHSMQTQSHGNHHIHVPSSVASSADGFTGAFSPFPSFPSHLNPSNLATNQQHYPVGFPNGIPSSDKTSSPGGSDYGAHSNVYNNNISSVATGTSVFSPTGFSNQNHTSNAISPGLARKSALKKRSTAPPTDLTVGHSDSPTFSNTSHANGEGSANYTSTDGDVSAAPEVPVSVRFAPLDEIQEIRPRDESPVVSQNHMSSPTDLEKGSERFQPANAATNSVAQSSTKTNVPVDKTENVEQKNVPRVGSEDRENILILYDIPLSKDYRHSGLPVPEEWQIELDKMRLEALADIKNLLTMSSKQLVDLDADLRTAAQERIQSRAIEEERFKDLMSESSKKEEELKNELQELETTASLVSSSLTTASKAKGVTGTSSGQISRESSISELEMSDTSSMLSPLPSSEEAGTSDAIGTTSTASVASVPSSVSAGSIAPDKIQQKRRMLHRKIEILLENREDAIKDHNQKITEIDERYEKMNRRCTVKKKEVCDAYDYKVHERHSKLSASISNQINEFEAAAAATSASSESNIDDITPSASGAIESTNPQILNAGVQYPSDNSPRNSSTPTSASLGQSLHIPSTSSNPLNSKDFLDSPVDTLTSKSPINATSAGSLSVDSRVVDAHKSFSQSVSNPTSVHITTDTQVSSHAPISLSEISPTVDFHLHEK